MTDAWMVTQGSYSNYGVVAVFTTQAAADAYASEGNAKLTKWDDKYEVERVDLDPPLPSVVAAVPETTP